jgi:transcriptional regulator GlxA family with amidase domain
VLDPPVERLARTLLKAGECEHGADQLFLDGIAMAIVARLLSANIRPMAAQGSRQGLVKWRLKRVVEFVEQHLADPLTLADLAECAGLSRMHFAAQFRAATGIRPHEYVIRKRVERAQEMLQRTSEPLVEVALSVGFQTQAHFTTVFRRLLDETPGRWRQLHRCQV